MRHQSGPAFVPQLLPRFEPLPVYNPVYAGTSAGTREPASRPEQQHYESAQEEYRNESTSPPPQSGFKTVRKRRRLLSQGELPRDEAMRKHFCPVPGCGKKFARPSALKTHNLSHTKEKRTSDFSVDSVLTFPKPSRAVLASVDSRSSPT